MKQGPKGEAPKISRSPSTDQKKVRRSMQQKTADVVPLFDEDGITTIASRPGYAAGREEGLVFGDSFISCDGTHPWNAIPTLRTRIAAHHMPESLPIDAAGAFIAGFAQGVHDAHTATLLDISADRLQPGDSILGPTGQTMRVKRVRNHETSNKHVYVDTDGGTTMVERAHNFKIAPHNTTQQETPGFGIPGANTNSQPFSRDHGQSNQVSSQTCPNCGATGSMTRRGGTYVCSRCGYHEQTGPLGEGANLLDSERVIKSFSSLDRPTAIASRARAVLNPLEEK
jgi:ribosomal protein S27AE